MKENVDSESRKLVRIRKYVNIVRPVSLSIILFGIVGLTIYGEMQAKKITQLEVSLKYCQDSINKAKQPVTQSFQNNNQLSSIDASSKLADTAKNPRDSFFFRYQVLRRF